MKISSINNQNFKSIKLKGDFKYLPEVKNAFLASGLYQELRKSKDSFVANLKTDYHIYPRNISYDLLLSKKNFLGFSHDMADIAHLQGVHEQSVTSGFANILRKL